MRQTWAEQGWERGALGYPVSDQHTPRGLTPDDHPRVSWTVFENGAVVATADGRAVARAAVISPDDMRRVIRRFFDQAFTASPDNVGLHAPVEIVDVSGWSHGFWDASPRVTTFALHGFHDNGLWADTDFKILVGLTFRLAWANSFTEPAQQVPGGWTAIPASRRRGEQPARWRVPTCRAGGGRRGHVGRPCRVLPRWSRPRPS